MHRPKMDIDGTKSNAVSMTAGERMDEAEAEVNKTQDTENETDDDTPALFVTSMPRDLWANPSLGGLAALIDESNAEQETDGTQGCQPKERANGGGSSTPGQRDSAKLDEKRHSSSAVGIDNVNNTVATSTTTRDDCSNRLLTEQQLATVDETGTTINPLYRHYDDPKDGNMALDSARTDDNSQASATARNNRRNHSRSGWSAAALLVGRHSRHRESVRRRRESRRAESSPYSGGRSNRSERARGGREVGVGENEDTEARQGPTAGETQVMMSLWGI